MARRTFACVGLHESCEGDLIKPDRYRWLYSLPKKATYIPQGSGLSLAGAGFGPRGTVVGMGHFNRILEFDPKTRTIHAEAGITLTKLFDFLTPRGFVVAVQPGYPDISLGGCIAGNVHGKNQYKAGCFVDLVKEITLFHPDKGVMTIDAASDPELFNLTCGGFGLTGIIVAAKIRVEPLGGALVQVVNRPVDSLNEAVGLMTVEQDLHDFMYSWHDLARFDDAMGRGFVVTGKSVTGGGDGEKRPDNIPDAASFNRPYPLPLFNAYSLRISNEIFYHRNRRAQKTEKLFDSLFPFVKLNAYFKAYGPRGFIEHQVLIPDASGLDYLHGFSALVRKYRQPFGLASLKRMSGAQTLLRYSGSGIGISLHLATTAESLSLLGELDRLNSEHGGVTNPLKDSRLSAQVLREQFSQCRLFIDRLHSFDPRRMFRSTLSERLEL